VLGVDELGLRAFGKPLHRLFLRGNLDGETKDDGVIWFIPFGEDAAKTLQRLTGHLGKYELAFELDHKCVEILRSVEEGYRAYQRILKDGLEAKKQISANEVRAIRDILGTGFKRELTAQQLQGVNHLLHVENGANLSVPGSGKTSVVLGYYHILKKRKVVTSLFVIGPSSSFEPWESECEACFIKRPRIVRLAGKPKTSRHEAYLLASKYEIFLTTYHSAARDVEDVLNLLRRRDCLVVLDESHYVKRPQGGILADAVLRLAPRAKRRVILTGTPMPNGLGDLWTQFTFLWHEQLPLGNAAEYLREIQERQKKDAMVRVKRTLWPMFYRVTKRELRLPRPTFKILEYTMRPLQRRIYRGVATRFLLQANEGPEDRESLREWRRARVIRLLQVASNPSLLRARCDEFQLPPLDLEGVRLREGIEHYASYEVPAKIEGTCEVVRSICKRGLKVIVWSTFVHNLKMVANLLKDLKPVVIHGGIPLSSAGADDFGRERLIHKFKTDPDRQVLIGNPAACGESISLHKVCHNAVYLDRSFNCAHYLQSLDRVHRLGLAPSDQIFYYLIVSEDSIDEIVETRLKEKMQDMREMIESPLPGEVPGYWSNDLGEEEDRDFELVEEHIRDFGRKHADKT